MAATASQPPEEKQLRSDYRALLQKAKDNQHDLASADGQRLKGLLEEADELHEMVSKPREQAADAQVFAIVTEGGVEYVKKLARGGKSLTTADFVRRLKARYVDDEDAQEAGATDSSAFDWGAVGRGLAGWFRTAPYCHHMLGPMDAVPKAKRAVAQRRKRDEVAEVVRPREVSDLDAEEKQETDRNMEEMWGVLKAQGGAANLLELVMNHRSFPQTLENCFSLSFLVRDGRVELRDGDDGVQVVQLQRPERGARQGSRAAGEADRVQFVMTQSMEVWEQWKLVVPEGATLMKHRAEWRPQGGQPLQEVLAQPGPSDKRARR